MTKPLPPPRLHVLLARDVPVGVIFRRGPSRHVLLSRWDLKTDRMQHGQWFKGRIYEHRCDLSPSGNYLVYFASQQGKAGWPTWTAISKPPYFTALQIWKGLGTWGGGGFFERDNMLRLSIPNGGEPLPPTHNEELRLPGWLQVSALESAHVLNEEAGINRARLLRDGWNLVEDGAACVKYSKQSVHSVGLRWVVPKGKFGEAIWDKASFAILNTDEDLTFVLKGTEWADWDVNGDLLFAKDGCLFRLDRNHTVADVNIREQGLTQVANLNPLTFTEVVAPQEALKW